MAVVSTAVPGDLRQTARHRAQSDVTNQLYGSTHQHRQQNSTLPFCPSQHKTQAESAVTRSTFQDYSRKAHLKQSLLQPLSCNSDWNTTGPREFKAVSKKPRQECNFYAILLLFLKLNGTSHKRWKLPGLENDGRQIFYTPDICQHSVSECIRVSL